MKAYLVQKLGRGVYWVEFHSYDTSNILSSDCIMGMACDITLLDDQLLLLSLIFPCGAEIIKVQAIILHGEQNI